MSEDRTAEPRKAEDGFFAGQEPPPLQRRVEPGRGVRGETPGKRESPLLARSPIFAVLVSGLAVWLLHGLWSDLSYFASPRVPIDLGKPGAYRLEAARENRLVQVQGRLLDTVTATDGRSGAVRTVGRLAGTNLLVDRPGRGGPDAFEGRLLPASRRESYEEVAARLRARGAPLGDGWQVLRDGERPRRGWWSMVGALLLAAVLAVNVRALLRPILRFSRERS